MGFYGPIDIRPLDSVFVAAAFRFVFLAEAIIPENKSESFEVDDDTLHLSGAEFLVNLHQIFSPSFFFYLFVHLICPLSFQTCHTKFHNPQFRRVSYTGDYPKNQQRRDQTQWDNQRRRRKIRLDSWISTCVHSVSRARVQSSIRLGLVSVNGFIFTFLYLSFSSRFHTIPMLAMRFIVRYQKIQTFEIIHNQ